MKKQELLFPLDLPVTSSVQQPMAKAGKKEATKQPIKLSPLTERFLAVINYAIATGVFKNEREALIKIKFGPINSWRLRTGKQPQTLQHMQLLCDLTGTSADNILGYKPKSNNGLHIRKVVLYRRDTFQV